VNESTNNDLSVGATVATSNNLGMLTQTGEIAIEQSRLGADSSSSVTITGTPALNVEAMAQFVCVQSVEFPMREGWFKTAYFHTTTNFDNGKLDCFARPCYQHSFRSHSTPKFTSRSAPTFTSRSAPTFTSRSAPPFTSRSAPLV
jgi:hypothetical protein